MKILNNLLLPKKKSYKTAHILFTLSFWSTMFRHMIKSLRCKHFNYITIKFQIIRTIALK